MAKMIFYSLMIFLVGCNYSLTKKASGASGNEAIERLPSGMIPGYQLIATGIIGPRCLECHSNSGGNAGGTNLETYENLHANVALIRDEVASGRMPKNRPHLSPKEIEVLLAWIDAGGPREMPTQSTEPLPAPPGEMPDPEKIDYQMVRTQVIVPRCLGCHSAARGNKGGVNLETYENIFEAKDDIKEAVINGDMPRPKNRPLPGIQKQILLLWIEKGAPETVPSQFSEDL